MKQLTTFITLLLLLLFAGPAMTQIPLEVQTSVVPPYPKQFTFWSSNASQFFVTVINNSDQDFDFFVKVSIESTDGQTFARFLDDFRPTTAFTIPANQMRTFDSAVIGNNYSNLSLDQLDISENIPIDANGELPAGEYQICVQLLEFVDDPSAPPVFLSPVSCSDPFEVNQGNIELIFPADGGEPIPSGIATSFNWTNNNLSALGPEQQYVLKIYELDSLTAANEYIYDLVETGSIPAFYTTEPSSDNFFIYNHDIGLPLMIEGYQYAAQVELTDAGGLYFENGGRSNINSFWYGHDPTDTSYDFEEEPVEQAQIDCFENCNFILSGNTTASTDPAPTTIAVGHFTMDDIEITSASNGYYTGTGRILIPWLNEVYVKTIFSSIKVNTDGRMVEGQVQGAQAPDIPTYAAEFNNFIATGRLIAGLAGSSATLDLPLGINQNIAGHNFLVGITEIVWTPTTADVNTACNFHIPAFGEEYVSLESSETCMHPGGFGNEFYLHMGQDLSINGNGEITVNIKGSSEADTDQIEEEACYLQMDCNGMKSISIKADVLFPESMLLKENAADGSILIDETLGAENRVKANFNFTLDRETGGNGNVYGDEGEEDIPYESGLHFIASATVEDPFQIKGVQGWGFQVNEIWVDASDVKNPTDIEFPEGFFFDDGIDAIVDDTWTGFYMKELTMRTPKEFLRDGAREEVSVTNVIIDPTVTLSIGIDSIVGINDGEVDKWSFSIDEIFMDIVQGRFEAGGMNGQVGLPITADGTFINYSAIISDSDLTNSELDSLEYIFTMNPAEQFDVPMLVAQVELDPASYIAGGVKPGSESATFFELYAAGGLALNSDLFSDSGGNSMLPLSSPMASFDLKFHSKNGFTRSNFGFIGDFDFENTSSSDGPSATTGSGSGSWGGEFSKESFSGFPLTIEGISIENTDLLTGDFTFRITPSLSLTKGEGNAVSADVTLDILSKLNYNTEDGNRLQLQGLTPSAIEIDSEMAGCAIKGWMEFYNNRDSEGVGTKGVKGGLEIQLPMELGVKMEAEFGTDISDPEAEYNTAENYPYFYVDGMAYFGSGIVVGGALAIYGVGGGLSYNMTRSSYEGDAEAVAAQLAAVNDLSPTDPDDLENAVPQPTGTVPVPAHGVMGLKVACTLGTFPVSSLVNVDISFEGEFEIDRGLTLLAIRGNGFMLTPLTDRSDPSVEVELDLVYERPLPGQSIFDGKFTMWANFYDIFYGIGENNRVGQVALHADNGMPDRDNDGSWSLHIGNPWDRMGFKLDFAGLLTAEANTYFMLGEGLPTTLPVPQKVEDLFGATSSGEGGSLDSGTISGEEEREEDDIQDAMDGTGFALGAEVSVNIDIDALGVYAYLGVFMGFDINVTHSPSRTCYILGEGMIAPGVNGWYASGQVYAGLEGGLGFRVKAFGKKHELELFDMKAAMMIGGGGPNPFWAEGRAGISISVLNGLIKCNKNLSVRVGEQCSPAQTDPFGGVPMIVEHWPEHNAKKQSTWTKPKISFTFPIDRRVAMPCLSEEDGETYTEYIEPKFENLVWKEEGKEVYVEFEQRWSDEGRLLELKPLSGLNPFTNYEVSLTLYALEYPEKSSGEGSGNRVMFEGKEWYQDTSFVFRAGKLGMLDEVISTSIPIRNQRYFVQDDVSGDEAAIVLDIAASQDLYFLEEDGNKDYEYFMRFSPMDGGGLIEVPLLPFGSAEDVEEINYILPELANEQTYAVQLIQKFTMQGALQQAITTVEPLSFTLANNTSQISSETTVEFTNEKINPAEDLGWNEKAWITYFFRTSKYNTYEDKFAAVNPTFDSSNEEIQLEMDELLDEFDVNGEFYDLDENDNPIQVMDPLVQFYDPMQYLGTTPGGFAYIDYTDLYGEVVRDGFVAFAESYEDHRFEPELGLPAWPEDDLYFDYFSDVELSLTSNVLNAKSALSIDEIDASWASLFVTNYNLSSASIFGNTTSVDIHNSIWDRLYEDRNVILDWAAMVKATEHWLEVPMIAFEIATFIDPNGNEVTVSSDPDLGSSNEPELMQDNGEWIDENYTEFDELVDDISLFDYSSGGFPGRYFMDVHIDKLWRPKKRGQLLKTFRYTTN